jgi:hypothetical protein
VEDRPVANHQSHAGGMVRKDSALPLLLIYPVQPEKVVYIRRQDAEDFQLPPAVTQHNDGHAADQHGPGDQVVGRRRVHTNGDKPQQEASAGDDLGIVLEHVPDHRGDHAQ